MQRRVLPAVAAAVLLTSCAQRASLQKGWWPAPPPPLDKPFAPALVSQGEMATIQAGVTALMLRSADAAGNANAMDWSSGDTTAAGGFMSIVGGIADRTGLVNTGAALALTGLTASQRYKYPTQTVAFDKAAKTFGCLRRQISLVPDAYVAWALRAGDDDVRAAATSAAGDAMAAIEQARLQLTTDLRSITSTAPSKDDLVRWAQSYAQAASQPVPAAPASAASAVTVHAPVPALAASGGSSGLTGTPAQNDLLSHLALLSAKISPLIGGGAEAQDAEQGTLQFKPTQVSLEPWEQRLAISRVKQLKTAVEGCNRTAN